MKSHPNQDLIQLLSDGQTDLRMLALHQLCEGYADAPEIFEAVRSGWREWGVEQAFPEFPMLSYLPVPAHAVEDCCPLAAELVEGSALKSSESRCAGKLMEQVVTLPATDLQPHLELLDEVKAKSKIFFRVDLDGVRDRIACLSLSSAELQARFETAVRELADDASQSRPVHQALHALEALRRLYPESAPLAELISAGPQDDGQQALRFQLALQSLVQFEQPGVEHLLAPYLLDDREAVYSVVVEALVRCGTPETASVLVNQFDDAQLSNQKWIARGLQRIRESGLAGRISDLRGRVSDPSLWVMLLIAEVRQLEANSRQRIAGELSRLQSFSKTLIDSLTVFSRLHENTASDPQFEQALLGYLQRANQSLGEQLAAKKRKLQRTEKRSRDRSKQQVLTRHRQDVRYRKKS